MPVDLVAKLGNKGVRIGLQLASPRTAAHYGIDKEYVETALAVFRQVMARSCRGDRSPSSNSLEEGHDPEGRENTPRGDLSGVGHCDDVSKACRVPRDRVHPLERQGTLIAQRHCAQPALVRAKGGCAHLLIIQMRGMVLDTPVPTQALAEYSAVDITSD